MAHPTLGDVPRGPSGEPYGIVHIHEDYGGTLVDDAQQLVYLAYWQGEVDGVIRTTDFEHFATVEEAIAWGRANAPRVSVRMDISEDYALYSVGDEPWRPDVAQPWPDPSD